MLKINPTKEAIDFHYKNVSKIFNNVIRDGSITRTINKKKEELPKCFLKFLKNYFDEIITGKPRKLLEIHCEFLKLSFSKEEFKLIQSFFLQTGYGNFQKKFGKEFLNYLNFDTCIYCNRNYTLQFDLETNHSRAELDHWFPKNEFPILSLSFYNLIPSCHSCNHMKGEAKGFDWLKALTKLNHPYLDKMDFSFSYYFKNLNDINSKIVVEENSKTEKTLIFNKTKEIYEAHSTRELKDLIDLRYKYPENYLKILSDTFQNISITKEESYRMIFGIEINEDDFHKRPFSKFKKDIIEELLRTQKKEEK